MSPVWVNKLTYGISRGNNRNDEEEGSEEAAVVVVPAGALRKPRHIHKPHRYQADQHEGHREHTETHSEINPLVVNKYVLCYQEK